MILCSWMHVDLMVRSRTLQKYMCSPQCWTWGISFQVHLTLSLYTHCLRRVARLARRFLVHSLSLYKSDHIQSCDAWRAPITARTGKFGYFWLFNSIFEALHLGIKNIQHINTSQISLPGTVEYENRHLRPAGKQFSTSSNQKNLWTAVGLSCELLERGGRGRSCQEFILVSDCWEGYLIVFCLVASFGSVKTQTCGSLRFTCARSSYINDPTSCISTGRNDETHPQMQPLPQLSSNGIPLPPASHQINGWLLGLQLVLKQQLGSFHLASATTLSTETKEVSEGVAICGIARGVPDMDLGSASDRLCSFSESAPSGDATRPETLRKNCGTCLLSQRNHGTKWVHSKKLPIFSAAELETIWFLKVQTHPKLRLFGVEYSLQHGGSIVTADCVYLTNGHSMASVC